jgi:hypothetical protein
MHLSEAYSFSEVILGSSQHRHLLNKHESILLTLIPPSVSIYGSQILLYKCLKYTNAIQMKPPSALATRVNSPRPQPVSAASPTQLLTLVLWGEFIPCLFSDEVSPRFLDRRPVPATQQAARSPSTFRTLLPEHCYWVPKCEDVKCLVETPSWKKSVAFENVPPTLSASHGMMQFTVCPDL